MHAKMPKFLGRGTLVKFAKSHPMHPKTPNVLPKHPICRTCWTIRVSHKTATTVHLPCLLVLPSRAKFLMVPANFLKNMVTYPPPPQPIHLRKALFKAISKRYNIPPPTRHVATGKRPTLAKIHQNHQ